MFYSMYCRAALHAGGRAVANRHQTTASSNAGVVEEEEGEKSKKRKEKKSEIGEERIVVNCKG